MHVYRAYRDEFTALSIPRYICPMGNPERTVSGMLKKIAYNTAKTTSRSPRSLGIAYCKSAPFFPTAAKTNKNQSNKNKNKNKNKRKSVNHEYECDRPVLM